MDEAENERAAVVAWLRRLAPLVTSEQEAALELAADNIAVGAHLRGDHREKQR